MKASPLRACLSLFKRRWDVRRVGTWAVTAIVAISLISASLGPAAATYAATSLVNAGSTGSGAPQGEASGGNYQPATGNASPSQEALSYSYYEALSGCIPNAMPGDFNLQDSDGNNPPTSEWFNGGNAYVYPGDSNQKSCADIMQSAMTLWGFSSSADFLTGMGYVYQPSYPRYHQENSDGNGTVRVAAFQQEVQSKIYGGGTPHLSAAATYDLDYLGFTASGSSCEAHDLGVYPTKNPTYNYNVNEKPPENVTSTLQGVPGSGSTQATYKWVKITIADDSNPQQPTKAVHAFAYESSSTTSGGVKQNSKTNDTTVNLYGYEDTGNNDVTAPTCDSLVQGINSTVGPYLTWLKNNIGQKDQGSTTTCSDGTTVPAGKTCPSGSDTTSCNIPGLGWIICPVLTIGAQLADSAYGFLAENFLETNPSLVNMDPNATDANGNTIGTGAYSAWKIMVQIADAAFVIVFLVIIFSQLTGAGINNYGVKKLLPRLIIGAILVNTSFFLCAIAIDVSNILGYSLKNMLSGVAQQVTASGGGIATSNGALSGSNSLTDIVGGIITGAATAAVVYINLGAVIVAMIAALLVLLTIFVLLVARQALIVLLVVVSPLAFVAYLLPNTESWFTKWRKMLTSLLLLFPIIGLLYGACELASAILLQAAGDNVVMKIAAYMTLVIPLIASIPLLKGSLDGVGKLGGAIKNLGSKAQGQAQGAAKRGVAAYKGSDWNKFRQGIKGERSARIRAGEYRGRGGGWNPRNWASGINKGINQNGAFNAVTGGYGSRRGKSAAKWEAKEIADKAEGLAGRLDSNGLPMDPQQLFDDALAEHQRVYSDPSATRVQQRDARIGLAAAQAHLLRSNGQAGAEYARNAINGIRSGGSAPAPSATPAAGGGSGGAGGRTLLPHKQQIAAYTAAESDRRAREAMHEAEADGRDVAGPSERLQDAAALTHADNQYRQDTAGEAQLSREQIQAMGEEHVQRFADSNGGISELSDGNLIKIANSHGTTDVGQQARQTLIDRGVITETKPRDSSTMPKQ